jgi:uncharacterized SAM-binding protein YcdF (DUF218 family)
MFMYNLLYSGHNVFKALVIELISPLQTSLFLVFMAALAKCILRSNKLASKLVYASLIWLLTWSQPYSADLLLYPLERGQKVKRLQYSAHKTQNYILVLACYYNTEGYIPEISRWSNCSLQRLVQTARLYKQTKSTVIVSGGHFLENKKTSYSQKAKAFLVSLGVPRDKIITTDKGTTTQEEIISASQFITNKSLLVVTSATHVLRVSNELQEFTKEAAFHPVDYHSAGELTPYLSMPSLSALIASRAAFYEYLALLKQYFT